MDGLRRRLAPLLASAFRPFYLLGVAYGLALMTAWTGAWLAIWPAPLAGLSLRQLHGHEMLFGFAAAVVIGIVLTALPSWAHTPEVRGAPLAVLVLVWLAGRVAVWSAPWPGVSWRAAIDLAFFPAVFVVVAPCLLRAANRLYLLLLPILLALFGAHLAWYAGMLDGSDRLATTGLRAGVYGLVALFVVKGGVLTPVFTGNALREAGRGDQARFVMALDAAALAVVVALACLDLAGAPANWVGATAVACTLVHAWRVARWKGWRVVDAPLVWGMHLGFAWLLCAFALKAAAELGSALPEAAWVHAFTVGSLGLMMLALMTRVVLRHTGRAPVAPRAMSVAMVAMFLAALARLGAIHVGAAGHGLVALAALLWLAPFATWFALYAAMLVTPSLPREIQRA
ncbi:MAG: NnrS family protein [Burkholderiaceae bacterium]|nr:NnrS family protein [Burkholderiaceae bacterium]